MQLLYTPEEATAPELMHMSLDSVLLLIQRKELRAVRVGRKILIPAKSIAQFCDRAFDDGADRIPGRAPKPSERRRATENGQK